MPAYLNLTTAPWTVTNITANYSALYLYGDSSEDASNYSITGNVFVNNGNATIHDCSLSLFKL